MFTHEVEEHTQVKDIIKILTTAACNITERLKNVAENLESIIESENRNLENVKRLQFFIEQMTHMHAYTPIMMKLTVSSYLRRQNCYNAMKQ